MKKNIYLSIKPESGRTTMENSMEVPQKTKYRTMTQQSHSWAYIQTKPSLKKIHAPHVHCTLLTIAQTWKQAKCPWTDEWIKMNGLRRNTPQPSKE